MQTIQDLSSLFYEAYKNGEQLREKDFYALIDKGESRNLLDGNMKVEEFYTALADVASGGWPALAEFDGSLQWFVHFYSYYIIPYPEGLINDTTRLLLNPDMEIIESLRPYLSFIQGRIDQRYATIIDLLYKTEEFKFNAKSLEELTYSSNVYYMAIDYCQTNGIDISSVMLSKVYDLRLYVELSRAGKVRLSSANWVGAAANGSLEYIQYLKSIKCPVLPLEPGYDSLLTAWNLRYYEVVRELLTIPNIPVTEELLLTSITTRIDFPFDPRKSLTDNYHEHVAESAKKFKRILSKVYSARVLHRLRMVNKYVERETLNGEDEAEYYMQCLSLEVGYVTFCTVSDYNNLTGRVTHMLEAIKYSNTAAFDYIIGEINVPANITRGFGMLGEPSTFAMVKAAIKVNFPRALDVVKQWLPLVGPNIKDPNGVRAASYPNMEECMTLCLKLDQAQCLDIIVKRNENYMKFYSVDGPNYLWMAIDYSAANCLKILLPVIVNQQSEYPALETMTRVKSDFVFKVMMNHVNLITEEQIELMRVYATRSASTMYIAITEYRFEYDENSLLLLLNNRNIDNNYHHTRYIIQFTQLYKPSLLTLAVKDKYSSYLSS